MTSEHGKRSSGPALHVVALGPGDPDLLGRRAIDILGAADRIWTDAPGHPAIARFAPGAEIHPISTASIAEIAAAAHAGNALCALLGDPRIDAAPLVARLAEAARATDIGLSILPAPAWLPEVLALLGDDPDGPGPTAWQQVDAQGLIRGHHPAIDPGRPALMSLDLTNAGVDDIAAALAPAYPADHVLRLAAWSPEGTRVESVRLADLRADAAAPGSPIAWRLLWIPALPYGHSWLDLAEIVAHLRAPDGCPWDREQTRQSLRPYLLEEAYEAVDALDSGDAAAFADELGDLLLQVVLHAQVAMEAGDFGLRDVLSAISGKLIRRHPHVFGDVRADTADEVLANWEALKGAERAAKGEAEGAPARGPLDGIPRAMPSLARAQLVLRKAIRIPELGAALPPSDGSRLQALVERLRQEPEEATLGEALWHMAAWSQAMGLDAEEALRRRTGEVVSSGATS